MFKKLLLALALLPTLALAQTAPTRLPGDNSNAIATTAFVAQNALGNVSVIAYGAACNGVTDDTVAFTNALAAAGALQGVSVVIPGSRCLINSGNITVPSGVTLTCENQWVGGQDAHNAWNYASLPCSIVLNGSFTINVNSRGALNGLVIINKNITVQPATIQAALTMVAGYTGTAITITGQDPHIQNALVLGFANCLTSSGWERVQTDHLYCDSTNGITIDNSHDISRLNDTEMYPFLTSNIATTVTSTPVSGAVNNAGLYRLTVGSTANFATGNTAWVAGVGGAVGANGKFTITVINSTTIDLQGSNPSPTPTANTTNGSAYMPVSSVANLYIGQGVSGTGIPGGATIAAIWRNGTAITLSAAATATNTGTALTITNAAYTSGGTVWINTNQRTGTGFIFTSGEGSICKNCFVIAWNTGFHLGTGSLWTRLIASDVDQDINLQDPTSIGYLIDGTANANTIADGLTSSVGQGIVINTSGVSPQIISNMHLNTWANGSVGGNNIELNAGRINAVNNETILSGAILTSSTSSWSTFGSGNWFPSVNIFFSSSTAQGDFHIDDWNNFANWHKGTPVLTSCGTGPAVNGASTDFVGSIAQGSGSSGCTINFAIPFQIPPICTVTARGGPVLAYSTTASTLIITTATGNVTDYNCGGRSQIQ